jgi:hypothetical protein
MTSELSSKRVLNGITRIACGIAITNGPRGSDSADRALAGQVDQLDIQRSDALARGGALAIRC